MIRSTLVALPLAVICFLAPVMMAQNVRFTISGRVSDPQGNPVANATVQLVGLHRELPKRESTDENGHFEFSVVFSGIYTLTASAASFQDVTQSIHVNPGVLTVADIHLNALTVKQESIKVVADMEERSVLSPDPAQRVYIREEMLDANPGRPGAPISIPGVPIETASAGIKAPQYFAPGVAGDHGEPMAQYMQVGTYLLPNNLSSNAHGNGYADPNILIPAILEGVQTDGGAFNVREGNHSENLSATYELRSTLEPSLTVTGDYRDIDAIAVWSPEDLRIKSWMALETAYGNGFLDRLEHRQQYKLNGFRIFDFGQHTLTLFGIGYYGFSYIPGLVPINVPNLHDTIDNRQKNQTHTGEIAANDNWRLSPKQQLQLSSFFRTYNLSLYSNFGDGLIRQSEFRTVTGGNGTYIQKLTGSLSLMAGVDYQRDAPRRLDLDHYELTDSSYYGPFQKVTANNVTLGDAAAYVALDGSFLKDIHYDLGWRRDQIQFDNVDLLHPLSSYNASIGFNSPKATISFVPADRQLLPNIAFSFAEAFYTNDPRIGTGVERGTPVSRAHSYQLVISKMVAGTDFRVTIGHITTEASLAKIDPDTGLQQDEGPGKNEFITIAARRYFKFGLFEASVSKANARDLSTGLPTPEAPRSIIDFLGTVNRLPVGLQARAEYDEVGRKPLGGGFTSIPVKEFRGAVVRPFVQRRIDVGANFLLASGYTGQTTEVLSLPGEPAPLERIVGVRLPSLVAVSFTYHFQRHTGLF